jgi:transposase InsO family protein
VGTLTRSDEWFYALLRGPVVDSSKLFYGKIHEWEHFYNLDRPHGGLSGQTPYERFKQKTSNAEPNVTENRQSL